jgi:hypothetical protein
VTPKLRRRFWIEIGIAAVSTALLALTLIWQDWIELAFGVDPDSYSGTTEWLIVAVTFAMAVVFVALARSEWRKAVALPA